MRRVLLPLAHSGENHWYDTIMFVTPMVVIISVLFVVAWRDRRADAALEDEDTEDPETAARG